MTFLKAVWGFLVGVKDALVLLFMLLLFGALWAGLSTRAPRVSVPDGAALHVQLNGVLVDEATPTPPLATLSGSPVIQEVEVADLVEAIDRATDDKRIAMIALDLDGFLGGGLANLDSVGQALVRFRATGRKVEAWATAYTDPGYYLAAHADQIGLSPMGAVLIAGPGGSGLYFKEALDRLKVTVEVFRVGTFKSAVEPFTRDDSSPEARAADQMLADDLWSVWRAGVQKQRPALDVAATLASWPARLAGANKDQAQLARDAGFVDSLLSRAAWHESLKSRLGAGDNADQPGDFRRMSFEDYLNARRPLREKGPAVAVVHVSGTIIDGDAPGGQAGSSTIARLIETAVADPEVKALVIRIDSPGGSATASEEIRQALIEARGQDLPVIASFGPVAASGGYWIATGADTVFAHPGTITGSIGVFGILPTFEGTLKSVGIHADGVSTTPFSGQPDLAAGLNEPTRLLIQGAVEDTYRQFVGLVAEARKLPLPAVEQLAEGRVWSGQRARDLGLVDSFGDLAAAVAEAGRRAGIEGKPRTKTFRPEQPFLAKLLSDLDISVNQRLPVDGLSRAVTASRLSALAQVDSAIATANGPLVQTACLACARHLVPRRSAPDLPAALGRLGQLLID